MVVLLETFKGEGLIEVRFIIDDIFIATVTEPPFNYQFETDDFTPGLHTLTAVGTLSNGSQIEGPKYQRVFLSAEEARETTLGLIVPLLVGVGGVIVLVAVFPIFFSSKKLYQFRQYGIAGGAVCPRCQSPFSRSVFAPNLVFGKLSRCPHCGKWAIVRRATPQELAAAEERYSEETGNLRLDPNAQAAQMRRELEDTRYE
jgi:hypothetical protein